MSSPKGRPYATCDAYIQHVKEENRQRAKQKWQQMADEEKELHLANRHEYYHSRKSGAKEEDISPNESAYAIEIPANSCRPAPFEELKHSMLLSSCDIARKAEMYQNYMKQIPIPTNRGSVIPCNTWMGLGMSIKQLYEQPLHYLTNVSLKQWDQLRIDSKDEHEPLDAIMHPCKAEARIWLTEEVHRITTSPHQIAKVWQSDSTYHAFIDPIFPHI